MTKKVNLLRFDASAVSDEEKFLFNQAFGTDDVQYYRTDPADYLEHSDQCKENKPDVVLLPKDRPIPAKAMEEGVDHVAVVDGKLMKLVGIKPILELYEPNK